VFKVPALLILVVVLAGCSSKDSGVAVNMDEMAMKKVEAAKAMAEANEKPDAEFALRAALERFRKIPFVVQSSPEATQQILEIYETRMKGKIRGEIAAEVDGDMQILAAELK
jgi:hypothetical protein